MVTATHKSELRSSLSKAFEDFMLTLSQFGDTNINEAPSAGCWTPAQVAVHIIMATDGVPDGHTSPAHRPYDANMPKIRPWWEDFSQKFNAPLPLTPDDLPQSKKILLEELERVKTKDLALIDKSDLSAVCLDFELPMVGYLTRFEWLWFSEIHLRRHRFQLENMLKASAGTLAHPGVTGTSSF